MATIRRFLLIEAILFLLAALVHGGHVVQGYSHGAARIAETVLAIALLGGLTAGLLRPPLTRVAGILVQVFALVGTLVGILTIIVGVGPQSVPDVVYHLAMVALLVWGIGVARSTPIEAGA